MGASPAAIGVMFRIVSGVGLCGENDGVKGDLSQAGGSSGFGVIRIIGEVLQSASRAASSNQ
jgi:hypothetical protein